MRAAAGVAREDVFSHEDGRWPSPVTGYECVVGEGDFPDTWEFDRIGACVPWPPGDWDGNTPALEAAVLPWIDRLKGCYPGQEVVERSLNVGHPARVLVAITGEKPLVAGEKIPLEGGGEGLVTSVAERGGIFRAFVRVPWAKRSAPVAGYRVIDDSLRS